MAAFNPCLPLFLLTLSVTVVASVVAAQSSTVFPFTCSKQINMCVSILYQDNGLQEDQIASYYSVPTSEISPITHGNKQDFIVVVPCSCKTVNGTTGYFYDTLYTVQQFDTFSKVSGQIYSGQAWPDSGEEGSFIPGNVVPMHLVCGCVRSDSQTVVTYTVQEGDTLLSIAKFLSAKASDIVRLNKHLLKNPEFIEVGWVLYVPAGTN
ncbi:hypothetical protein RJ639_044749 [Escallonia herrerae]|uniref:LysM domain-containing protein n=1 Tax=Escallonia herrerae TaxID=1293975 RepID=A0AA88WJP9_9ASTE|nr:hypothetical protein RJ639_044749 [Escallonia herrerae]